MGRSVVDLAQNVDDALGRLAQARGLEAQASDALRLAQADVRKAEADVAAARDALFAEHPDLSPTPRPTIVNHNGENPVAQPSPDNPALLPGQDPSKFEVVEVDDANDPRFTAGAGVSPIPTGDGEPLPPVEWEEHDA